MKKILSKVMVLVLLGSALSFASCNKDYENDLNQLRDDTVSMLEDQNQALLNAIETAKQEAIAHADAAEEAAKEYADKVAAAEAATAKAEAIAEAQEYTDEQVAAALDEAIAAAKTFADEALEAANKYADEAAKAAYEKAHKEMLDHVQKECEKTLNEAKNYAKNYTDQEIDDLERRMKKTIEEVEKALQTQIDANTNAISANTGRIETLEDVAESLRNDLDKISKDFANFKNQVEEMQKKNVRRFEKIEGRLTDAEKDIKDNTDAIKDNEKKINDHTVEIDRLQDEIKRLEGDIKSNAEAIKDLQKQIDVHTSAIEALRGEIDKLKAAHNALAGRVTCCEENITALETRLNALSKTLSEEVERLEKIIQEQVEALEDAIEAVKKELDREIGRLAKKHQQDSTILRNLINDEIADRMEADEAEATERAEQDKAIREDIQNLKDRLDEELTAKFQAIDQEFTDLRTDFNNAIIELRCELKKYTDEQVNALDKKHSERLTSISLIPTSYVDGIPALTVSPVMYRPIDIDMETEKWEYVQEVYSAPFEETTLRYHLSPAHITSSGIASAAFLYEKADKYESYVGPIITSEKDNEILEITDAAVNETNNEFEINVRRRSGKALFMRYDGVDWFKVIDTAYTAALRLEIAKHLLAEGETEAYVTSEYRAIYEHIGARLILGKNGMYTLKTADGSYTRDYEEAKAMALANGQDDWIDYGKSYDLKKAVEAYVSLKDDIRKRDEFRRFRAKEMEELGYEFRFVQPKDQDSYTLENGVITSIGREALGKTAIVRAELVDNRGTEQVSDDKIVDVKWIVIRWGLDHNDLGLVYEGFNYEVNCTDAHNVMSAADFQKLVLDKVVPYGISEKQLIELFNSAIAANPGTAYYGLENKSAKNNSFVWNVEVEVNQDMFEKLMKEEEYVIEGKFTISPKDAYTVYINTIDFQMNMKIVLPQDMPEVDPDNFKEISWQVKTNPGELARVAPVAFDKSVYHDGDKVAFDYNVKNLFKKDPIVKNVIGFTPESGKACRAWDIVFNMDQMDGVGRHQPHFLVAGDRKGLNQDLAEIVFTFNPAAVNENWFQQNAESIQLKVYNQGSAYRILNDFDQMDKRINLDIVAKINDNSVYAVHGFQMYVVNPINVPFPALASTTFKDDRYHKSAIDVRHAFDAMTDFQNVQVIAYKEDASDMEIHRRDYYGVTDPVWHVDQQRWTADTESDVLPTVNDSDLSTHYEIEFRNRELTYKNKTANYLTEPIAVWIPVTVSHEWDVKTQWVKFIIEPVKE